MQTVAESETLTCSKCGYSVVRAKAISDRDDLPTKCPKCKQQSNLGEWRSPSHVGPSNSPAADTANEKSIYERRFEAALKRATKPHPAAQIVWFMIGAASLCVFIGFTLAAVYSLMVAMNDGKEYGVDRLLRTATSGQQLRLIWNELTFFRNLVMAYIFFVITRRSFAMAVPD